MARTLRSESHRERRRSAFAAHNALKNPTVRRLVDLGAAVAVAAVVVDAVLTYVLLEGSVHVERNPIIGSAMRAIGIAPTLTLGTLLRFAIVAALVYIATRAVRPAVRGSPPSPSSAWRSGGASWCC